MGDQGLSVEFNAKALVDAFEEDSRMGLRSFRKFDRLQKVLKLRIPFDGLRQFHPSPGELSEILFRQWCPVVRGKPGFVSRSQCNDPIGMPMILAGREQDKADDNLEHSVKFSGVAFSL